MFRITFYKNSFLYLSALCISLIINALFWLGYFDGEYKIDLFPTFTCNAWYR